MYELIAQWFLTDSIQPNSSLSSSLVLDHLLLDVLGHLAVEPEPLPLCVEGGGLAVPADEPVEPGGDVALDEVLGVDVQGLQQPRVPLQEVLLMVSLRVVDPVHGDDLGLDPLPFA